MNVLKNAIAAACAAAAAAGTAADAGEAYLCNAHPLSGPGWIPDEFVIEFLDHGTAARVSDAAFSATLPGRVTRRSAATLEVAWSALHHPVGAVDDTGHQFRALLNMANMKMTIKALHDHGMIRLSRGAGRCVPAYTQSLLAQKAVN